MRFRGLKAAATVEKSLRDWRNAGNFEVVATGCHHPDGGGAQGLLLKARMREPHFVGSGAESVPGAARDGHALKPSSGCQALPSMGDSGQKHPG